MTVSVGSVNPKVLHAGVLLYLHEWNHLTLKCNQAKVLRGCRHEAPGALIRQKFADRVCKSLKSCRAPDVTWLLCPHSWPQSVTQLLALTLSFGRQKGVSPTCQVYLRHILNGAEKNHSDSLETKLLPHKVNMLEEVQRK